MAGRFDVRFHCTFFKIIIIPILGADRASTISEEQSIQGFTVIMLCSSGTFHCIIRLVCVYAFLKDCQSFFFFLNGFIFNNNVFWISNTDL